MDIALLVLRVVVGLLMAGHGAQKLFGSFGGHGLDGTAGFMESLGMRPGRRHASAAGAAELAGGVLLTLGLLTPLGSALIIAVMVVAIATVHGPKGPWVTDGGYEYNVVIIAVAFALAGAGPGEVSLDNALGWMTDITGAGWAFLALAFGALGGIGTLIAARAESRRPAAGPPRPPTAPRPSTSSAPPAAREGRFDREPDETPAAQRDRPGIPADPR